MQVIGIAGLSRSGKDTVAEILEQHYGYKKIAFADPLKEASAVLLGRPLYQMYEGDREAIMPEWGFSIRHFLQMLGTEGMRNLFRDDFWIHRMGITLDEGTMWQRPPSRVVISDVRFENEADFIRGRGGLVVHVTRPEAEKNRMAHASEAGIVKDAKDYTIANDGSLADLEAAVVHMMKLFEK